MNYTRGIVSFTSNILPILKGEKPNLISVITIALSKVANLFFILLIKEFSSSNANLQTSSHTKYEKNVDDSLIILCQVQARKTRFNILWITLLLNFNYWRKDITGVQTTYKNFHNVKNNYLPQKSWKYKTPPKMTTTQLPRKHLMMLWQADSIIVIT